jgi:hypothetical protein
MIKIEAPESQLKAASLVARSVELLNVSLTHSKFRFSNDGEDVAATRIHMDVKFPKPHHSIRNQLLSVSTKIKVIGKRAAQDNQKFDTDQLQIEVEYTLEFGLPPGEIPEKIRTIGLPAFAKYNGPYICWPYFRQHIHSLCASANIPGITLPTLTVNAKQKRINKKARRADS